MAKEYRGLIHIHSKHSFDGTLTLQELAALSEKQGINFLVLTEHGDGEYFNPEKMAALVEDCRKLSNETFLMIPGLEFMCEDMHILAIGLKGYLSEETLEKLIDRIHEREGLAILAHVSYYTSIPYERLRNLDGIEAWNNRYDGRFSPSIKSLRILDKFREQKRDIVALGGLDLHKERDFGRIKIKIKTEMLREERIISALRMGEFTSTNNYLKLPPKGSIITIKILSHTIQTLYKIANKTRRTLSILKKNVK